VEDEWNNVEENTNKAEQQSVDAKSDDKPHLDTTKILTDEDLERIRMLKKKRLREDSDNSDSESEEENDPLILEASDIMSKGNKAKMNKQERQESVKKGQEGETHVSAKKRFKLNKKGGTTNEEKLKNKPFMLVKNKPAVREKLRSSLQVKRAKKTKHVQTMKNAKKKEIERRF